MAAQSLASIEAARSAALAASAQLMTELGLGGAKRSLEGAASMAVASRRARSKAARKSRTSASEEAAAQPRRRSLRQQGLQSDGTTEIPRSEQFSMAYEPPARPQRTPGDVSLSDVAANASSSAAKLTEWVSSAETKASGGTPRRDTHWGSLTLRNAHHMQKVVPKRIYSLDLHPGACPLAAVGDRNGMLGLWRPSSGALFDSDGEEQWEDEGSTMQFQPHSRPVNALKCLQDTIMTCSYEGNVRFLDLNTQSFREAYVHFPEKSGPAAESLAYADVSADSRMLVASSHAGELALVDTRTLSSRNSVRSKNRNNGDAIVVSAHERKCASVQIHPSQTYAVSASHDNSVAIWDLRKLTQGRQCRPAVTLLHGGGVTSAFFSECGSRLVSTCNDDRLRVWHDAPLCSPQAPCTIKHDCHTGRWLSNFRCIFDPADPHTVLVGAMRTRQLLVIDADKGTRRAALEHENLTAVPTLNAVHKTLGVVASATASGRVHMWSAGNW